MAELSGTVHSLFPEVDFTEGVRHATRALPLLTVLSRGRAEQAAERAVTAVLRDFSLVGFKPVVRDSLFKSSKLSLLCKIS